MSLPLKLVLLLGAIAVSGSMNDVDRQAILNRINQYRSTTAQGNTPNQPGAANMEEMLWDPALEKVAQSYADKCSFTSNVNRQSEYASLTNQQAFLYTNQQIGEGVYQISHPTLSVQEKLLSGLTAWYNSHSNYAFNNNQCSSRYCGLYQQLVSANTRYVGCGYKECGSGLIFVCDFAVASPYNSQPYASGSPCSKCPSDRSTCSNGLCTGCPALGFYQCNIDKYSNCAPGTENSLAKHCTNCGQPSQSTVCDWCPKTCKYCSAVSPADQTSPSCCPALNPRFGCSAKSAKPTNKPTTPQPTPRPTLKPTPVGGVAPCTGLTASVTFPFQVATPPLTCNDYKASLKRIRPCMTVTSCTDVPFPNFPSYRQVKLHFQCDMATWNTHSTWKNEMTADLESQGASFTGAQVGDEKPNNAVPIISLVVVGGIVLVACVAGALVLRRRRKVAVYEQIDDDLYVPRASAKVVKVDEKSPLNA